MAFPGRGHTVDMRLARWLPALLLLGCTLARADVTITVDTNLDLSDPNDAKTSLREAIDAANGTLPNQGTVFIRFSPAQFPANPTSAYNHVANGQYYDTPDLVAPANDPNRIIVAATELQNRPGYVFDAGGQGQPLPAITRSHVRIIGDVDNNGVPDVRLDLADVPYTWLIPGFIPIPARGYGLKVVGASDVVINGLDMRYSMPSAVNVRASVPAVWFAGGGVNNCQLITSTIASCVIGCEANVDVAGNQVFVGGISAGYNVTFTGCSFAGVYTPTTSLGTATVQQDSFSGCGTTTDTDDGADYSGAVVIESPGANAIGGTVAGSANTFTGNLTHAIVIGGSAQNFVQNNTLTGSSRSGIFIVGSGNNIIGGSATLSGNVITNNGNSAGGWNHAGINVAGSGQNIIQGNYIGIGRDDAPGGNGGAGIHITSDANTVVGGTASAARNIICFNGTLSSSEAKAGIRISGNGASTIENNYIGVGHNGNLRAPNTTHGIEVEGNGNNTIGGTQTASLNVISANTLNGIRVGGTGANVIKGNYVGPAADGVTDMGNSVSGVEIASTATGANTIGGTAAAERNVISGNGTDGVTVNGTGANLLFNNYVGLAFDGATRLANGRHGVSITAQATGQNTVGGSAPGQRNVVTGNTGFGLNITGTSGGGSNQIRGNYIGLNAAATAGLGNGAGGISVNATVAQTIGGVNLGDGNVIAGNNANTSADGIELLGTGNHVIIGNVIGAAPLNPAMFPQDARLSAANTFRNGGAGILIGGGSTGNMLIGTNAVPTAGATPPGTNLSNVIVNNGLQGIQIASSGNVTVVNTFVGTGPDATGNLARMPNLAEGILVSGDGNNQLGYESTVADTASAHFYNVISGNDTNGVSITGPGTNQVLHNRIGTDAGGTVALANGTNRNVAASSNGVSVTGNGANLVRDNTISGNANYGLYLFGLGTYTVTGNSIGLNGIDRAGTAALPNAAAGVFVPANAPGTLVLGGAGASDFNVISGNGAEGVRIEGNVANTIQLNLIGTNGAGTGAVANTGAGVHLQGAATTVTVVTGNTISGNGAVGVNLISGANQLYRNKIGTDLNGSLAVPNASHGIYLNDPNLPTQRQGQVIGRLAAGNVRESNIISGNRGDGIHVAQAGGDTPNNLADDVQIFTNLIGVDSTGLRAIPNGGNGIAVDPGCTGKVDIGGRLDATGTPVDGQGNLISGNTLWGIRYDAGFNLTAGNDPTIYGNLIGTDSQGEQLLANGSGGILITTAAGGTGAQQRLVTIGGVRQVGAQVPNFGFPFANLISGNNGPGISLQGTAAVSIQGNFVGCDAFARKELGNAGDGIVVGATATGPVTLGYDPAGGPTVDPLRRNIVCANTGYGLNFGGSGTVNCANSFFGIGEQNLAASLFDTGGGNRAGGILLGGAAGQTTTASVRVCDVERNTTAGLSVTSPAPSTALIDGNLFKLNAGQGIDLNGGGVDTVTNNQITQNTGDGVRLTSTNNAVVGTTSTAAAASPGWNAITLNGGNGVTVNAGSNDRVSGNLIQDNGVVAGVYNQKLGIDIGGDGTTDIGLRLNALAYDSGTGNWTVSGTLPTASTTFGNTAVLELYQAKDPDPIGDPSLAKHRGQVDHLLTRLTTATGVNNTTHQFTATIPNAAITVAANQLLVTALAIDVNGNTSEFARDTGQVSPTASLLTVSPNSIPADGSVTALATVTVRDFIGTPLPNVANVVFSAAPAPASLVVTPALGTVLTTDANGQATAQFKATSRPDCSTSSISIGATIGGVAVTPNATLALTVGGPDPAQSAIVAAPATGVPADGTTTSSITITVRDVSGCAVPNIPADQVRIFQVVNGVKQTTPDPKLTLIQPTAATSVSGQTIAGLRSTGAGTFAIGFSVNGVDQATGSPAALSTTSVTFVPGGVDINQSSLTANPTTVPANNQTPSTLTLVVRDAQGNPIAGVLPSEISLTGTPSAGLTVQPFTNPTDANGQTTTTVVGSTPGTVTFVATVRGKVISQTAQLSFTVGSASAQSSLIASPTTVRPNGADTVTLTATVKDANNNPVPGVSVTITATQGQGITIVGPSQPTDANGQTTATATATQPNFNPPAIFTATAIVAGQPMVLGQTQVVFKVADPDPARSTLTITTEDPLLANGQRRATVRVRLIDVQGGPLQGVNPSEFTVAATLAGNATGLTVTPPQQATDANGETTFTLTSTTAGVATIAVTVRGITLPSAGQAAAQVTFLPYLSQSYGPGLHMIGLAGTPVSPDPRDVLKNLLPDLHLARFDETNQKYRVWDLYQPTEPFAMNPGRGFWLQVSSAVSFVTVGTPTPLAPFTLNLARGWNQLANPFPAPYNFQLSGITVLQNGQTVGTLDQPAARALVDPYGWRWDPVLQYLLLVDPSTSAAGNVNGTVELGRGWWMICRGDGVSLVLNPPTAGGRSRVTRAVATPGNWLASLEASTAGGQAEALFGAGTSRLRAEAPPDAPVPTPVSIRFVDDDGRAASDVRVGPLATRQTWQVAVTSADAGDVTLRWTGLSRALPRNHRLWLTDPTTGKRLLMNTRASYVWTGTAGGTRNLTVELDPHGSQRLTIVDLSSPGGRGRGSAIPISVSLTGDARLTVSVRGLGGRLVDQFTADGHSGTNTIAWDGKDQSGRTVPAGSYQLEVTATTDEGEIARASRTVNVR